MRFGQVIDQLREKAVAAEGTCSCFTWSHTYIGRHVERIQVVQDNLCLLAFIAAVSFIAISIFLLMTLQGQPEVPDYLLMGLKVAGGITGGSLLLASFLARVNKDLRDVELSQQELRNYLEAERIHNSSHALVSAAREELQKKYS